MFHQHIVVIISIVATATIIAIINDIIIDFITFDYLLRYIDFPTRQNLFVMEAEGAMEGESEPLRCTGLGRLLHCMIKLFKDKMYVKVLGGLI